MADQVATKRTSLPAEDTVVRSVQFFTTGRWRAQTQSTRMATFAGRPPIPVGLLIVTIIGFMACIVPGIIAYILMVKKTIQLQNIVVTATPRPDGGSEVVIKHSQYAAKLVKEFLAALPD